MVDVSCILTRNPLYSTRLMGMEVWSLRRKTFFLVLLASVSLLFAGCISLGGVAVKVTPNPIVVKPDATSIGADVELKPAGMSDVYVDQILVSLRDAKGNVVENAAGEPAVQTVEVDKQLPAYGVAFTTSFELPIDYDTAKSAGADHVQILTFTKGRPTQTIVAVQFADPEPEPEPDHGDDGGEGEGE